MIRPRGLRPAAIRSALALLAIIDLVSFYFFIGAAQERALGAGAPIDRVVAVLSPAPVRALIIAIGIAGAVAFARGAGRLGAGLFPFIALMLLSAVHARLYGSPFRHLYYSGLCLLGWLIGLIASRASGRPSDESYARIGSIALLGAAYLNAGISKLAYGGFEWAGGAPIQAAIVAQDGLVRDGLVSAYRSWVAMSPAVAGLFAVATVLAELAGPLMILGGRTRVIVALGPLCMHLNIFLLTHIIYWESMLLLILLGILPHEEPPQPRAAALSMLATRRGFIGSVVALSVAALFAIGHQGHRYHAGIASPAASGSPPAGQVEPAPALQRIGPFSLGDHVTDEWSIQALSATGGGFTVTLLGHAGRARFEVTCAAEHRSPFDVGSAHIFYFPDAPFPVLEPIGNALRDRLRAAAPRDPCGAVNEWMQSTR